MPMQITIILRLQSLPCQADLFPMPSYHHHPASSRNGGLVDRDQTRTCYRVPWRSRHRPRKQDLDLLVKMNRIRSAKHLTADRQPRGRPRKPKRNLFSFSFFFLFSALANGIQWSFSGATYCARRFGSSTCSFPFVGSPHLGHSIPFPFLPLIYRSFNPPAFLVSILVTAMYFLLFTLLFSIVYWTAIIHLLTSGQPGQTWLIIV